LNNQAGKDRLWTMLWVVREDEISGVACATNEMNCVKQEFSKMNKEVIVMQVCIKIRHML
jgi:hypothetical protein